MLIISYTDSPDNNNSRQPAISSRTRPPNTKYLFFEDIYIDNQNTAHSSCSDFNSGKRQLISWQMASTRSLSDSANCNRRHL